MSYFLKIGADINYQNKNGQTALKFAASNKKLENVKVLVQKNADKNLKDNNGKTALDYAKEKGILI